MDDNEKLQMIRMKVEELQGLSGAWDYNTPENWCDRPDDDNLVNDDFSTGLSGRKSRRRNRRAMAAEQQQPGAPQAAPAEEGMGDLSVGVGQSSMASVLGVISLASSGISAYHGYRRNDSLGWGVAWGVIGAVFPIITPAIALAQGFGQPIGKSFGRMPNPSDFLGFCRNATDSQLEAILEKEWEGAKRDEDRQADYDDAEREAERRGWSVSRGRRL